MVTGIADFPLESRETNLRLADRAQWGVDDGSGSHLEQFGGEVSHLRASQLQPGYRFGLLDSPTDTTRITRWTCTRRRSCGRSTDAGQPAPIA